MTAQLVLRSGFTSRVYSDGYCSRSLTCYHRWAIGLFLYQTFDAVDGYEHEPSMMSPVLLSPQETSAADWHGRPPR